MNADANAQAKANGTGAGTTAETRTWPPFVQLFGCFQKRAGVGAEQGTGVPTAPLRGVQRAQDGASGGHWPPSSAPLLAGPLLTFSGQRKLTRRLRRADLRHTARLTAADAAEMVRACPAYVLPPPPPARLLALG